MSSVLCGTSWAAAGIYATGPGLTVAERDGRLKVVTYVG